MKNDYAKKLIDIAVYEAKNHHILNADGSINMGCVSEMLLSDTPNGQIKDIVIDSSKEGKEIEFSCTDDVLCMYVPKELRDKIEFAVEYVLDEFDKINAAISDLALQFHIDRVASIINAEQVLINTGYELTDTSKQTLIVSRNDVGIALNQLSGSIKYAIEEINGIPRGVMKRLKKIKVSNVLEKEKQAHIALLEYVKGIGIYCEMSLRLGERNSAVNMLENGKRFLDSFSDVQYERMEGWNQKKDMFWIENILCYKNMLIELQEKMKQECRLRILMED